MAKAKKAAAQSAVKRPSVVFDVKMPQYQYRQGDEKSLSVDRRPAAANKASLDCLANLKV